MPDGYPDEVDYFSEDIKSNSKLSTDGGTMYSLVIETSDGPSEVVAFYKSFFAKNGFGFNLL